MQVTGGCRFSLLDNPLRDSWRTEPLAAERHAKRPAQSCVPADPRDLQRFWSNVRKGDENSCWLWTGGKDRDGYGRFHFGNRYHAAHRVSWCLAADATAFTPIVIRHACDNPACVNPRHLDHGTQAENMQDRDERARGAKGARNGRAKLTESQVLEIKRSPLPARAIARLCGLDHKTVRDIRKGINWAHTNDKEAA